MCTSSRNIQRLLAVIHEANHKLKLLLIVFKNSFVIKICKCGWLPAELSKVIKVKSHCIVITRLAGWGCKYAVFVELD